MGNGGFGCTKEKRKLIVEKYEEKRGGLGSTVDLILYRNRRNCEEKRWGLERTVDLILYRNRTNCEEKRLGLEQTVDLLYKRKESILKKKDGVLTNGGFEKQQKKKKRSQGLSESLTRFTKKGVWAQRWIC